MCKAATVAYMGSWDILHIALLSYGAVKKLIVRGRVLERPIIEGKSPVLENK